MDKKKTADNLNNLYKEIDRLEKCIIKNTGNTGKDNREFIRDLIAHTEKLKYLSDVLVRDSGFEFQKMYKIYEKEK